MTLTQSLLSIVFIISFSSPRFLLCTHRLIWKYITEIIHAVKLTSEDPQKIPPQTLNCIFQCIFLSLNWNGWICFFSTKALLIIKGVIIKKHRIRERVRLEEDTVGQLVQPQSTWNRIVSRLYLNISCKGPSTPSMGSLFQCWVPCTGKRFFLVFKGE